MRISGGRSMMDNMVAMWMCWVELETLILEERRVGYISQADQFTHLRQHLLVSKPGTSNNTWFFHNQRQATIPVVKTHKQIPTPNSFLTDSTGKKQKHSHTNPLSFTHQAHIISLTTPFLSKRVSVTQSVNHPLCDKTPGSFQVEMKGRRFDPQDRQETFSLGLQR
jgi:hypothetical protein